jgi:uncharacterized membrane protein YhaH (DUF805 family)
MMEAGAMDEFFVCNMVQSKSNLAVVALRVKRRRFHYFIICFRCLSLAIIYLNPLRKLSIIFEKYSLLFIVQIIVFVIQLLTKEVPSKCPS